jgi:hypothetical protein
VVEADVKFGDGRAGTKFAVGAGKESGQRGHVLV